MLKIQNRVGDEFYFLNSYGKNMECKIKNRHQSDERSYQRHDCTSNYATKLS